jgi:hypothetical protein
MRLNYQLSLGITLLVLLITSSHAEESVWDKAQVSYFGPSNITVYRSPSCGCCEKWLEHLAKHHFTVTDIKTDNIQTIKQQHGVPPQLASCHTAVIEGYVIEGHVPADDIKRLLLDKPAIAGLTVPAMPVGTPGMEMGSRKDPFQVLQFDKEGKEKRFNAYQNY